MHVLSHRAAASPDSAPCDAMWVSATTNIRNGKGEMKGGKTHPRSEKCNGKLSEVDKKQVHK